MAAARTPPTDVLLRALYDVLTGSTETDPKVVYAHQIYKELFERELMQAWVISRASDIQIQAALRVPVEVSETYRTLFFDTTTFRDELQLLSWVRNYEATRQGTQQGVQLIKQGLMGGPNMLAWIYGRGEQELNPQQVAQQVMADAYYRSKANRQHALGTKELAVTHQLMSTALKAAAQVAKVEKVITDVNELRIKLQHKDLTTSIEDVENEDILH